MSQDPHPWGFVAYQIVPRGCCGTSAPIEWDNVILYGQYVLDRTRVR